MGRINCIVIRDYSNKRNRGKSFVIGDKVSGDLIQSTIDSSIPMFKTDDGYFIVKSCLKPMSNDYSNSEGSDGTYAEVVEEKPKLLNVPKDFKATDFLKKKSKVAVNGGLAGLVVGFGYAVAKSKNKMIWSVIGSVVGFGLGTIYNNYVNSDNKEENDNKDSI